uniref:Transposase n=1 Tax=Steinernema glaseri TaxID=37863 RepID=A0A1I7YPL1_9BILA
MEAKNGSPLEVGVDSKDYFFRGQNREIVVLEMFTCTARYFKNCSYRSELPDYAYEENRAIDAKHHHFLDDVIDGGKKVGRWISGVFSRKRRPVMNLSAICDME